MGFWIIEAANLDEALAWTKKAPLQGVAVEVRPLVEEAGEDGHLRRDSPRAGPGEAVARGWAAKAPRQRRRPHVSARVGAGGRDADPRSRRLRRRRRGGARRRSSSRSSAGRATGVPSTRAPGSPRSPATAPSTASAASASSSATRLRSSGGSRRSRPPEIEPANSGRGVRRDRGRPPAADLHLLPSRARDRGPRRAAPCGPSAASARPRSPAPSSSARARWPSGWSRPSSARSAKAGIPYHGRPTPTRMPERLPGVLATLYLIFNEG